MRRSQLAALVALVVFACAARGVELRAGVRTSVNGWLVVQTEGAPYERGYQFGAATASEYLAAFAALDLFSIETLGYPMSFFIANAVELHAAAIPAEYVAEMQGIADGITAASGARNVTLDEIIGWNDYMELSGYWLPTVSTSAQPRRGLSGHCSAFAATGSATATGGIVIGHTTFMDFVPGQAYNVLLDVTPADGYRVVMQTAPGMVSSMTDFFVTEAGLIITETTIVNFAGYSTAGVPEWVRSRQAAQYASSIAAWVELMTTGNNGGYANSWLVGEVASGAIAELELGLTYTSFTTTTDGWLYGDNIADSPQIRNLECTDVGYSDVRQSTGARRVRWPQVLEANEGNISLETGAAMLADTFDPYTLTNNPSSRTICAHFDADPQFWASDPALFNVPFLPMGSIDAKIATSEMLADGLALALRWGRADGVAFDASAFVAAHPQFAWQAPVLASRPSQPWWQYNAPQKTNK